MILFRPVTQAALNAVAATILPAANQAETEAATITNKAVVPAFLRIKVVGTAFLGGDLTGNTRGTSAIDVQNARSLVTQVSSGIRASSFGVRNTASGNHSSASGYYNTASGSNSVAMGHGNTAGNLSIAVGAANTASSVNGFSSAIGYNNTASGYYGSSAIGRSNTASGEYSSVIGYSNTGSGYQSNAFGFGCNSSGIGSTAIGRLVKTTVGNSFEVGCWANTTLRLASVRANHNGQIAKTIVDSAAAPTDGGATAGSEANGTLARGMYAIQKNGTLVTLYFNNAGTIQSLALGSLL